MDSLHTTIIYPGTRIVLWHDEDHEPSFGYDTPEETEEAEREERENLENGVWEVFGLTLETVCGECGTWKQDDREPGLWGIVVVSPNGYDDEFVRQLWADHIGDLPTAPEPEPVKLTAEQEYFQTVTELADSVFAEARAGGTRDLHDAIHSVCDGNHYATDSAAALECLSASKNADNGPDNFGWSDFASGAGSMSNLLCSAAFYALKQDVTEDLHEREDFDVNDSSTWEAPVHIIGSDGELLCAADHDDDTRTTTEYGLSTCDDCDAAYEEAEEAAEAEEATVDEVMGLLGERE